MGKASRIVWLETAWQDVRYGFRQLRRARALVAVAVLSLAIGIGANTAVFTLINAFMLQFLPVQEPGRLVLFYDGIATGVYSGNDPASDEFSYPSYQYLKTHNDSFADLCAFKQGIERVTLHVSGDVSGSQDSGRLERAKVHLVSGNYFQVLGVSAAAGRVLTASDDTRAASPPAVLSYSYWRGRFHLDPGVLGRSVVLNGTSFTIIGVAAREFFGERIETAPDFWLPLSAQPEVMKKESYLAARDVYWLNFMGRLKPGVTMAGAQASVTLRLRQFYREQAGLHPSRELQRKIAEVRVQLKPGGGGISGLRYLYSEPLHVLMAVVMAVLLIACANVATLLLARASARRPEFLARLALGASRGRLLRQVLTESMLLSFLGGVVGVGFAWVSVRMLVVLLHVNPVVRVRPDPVILLFTLALCIVTGICFGIFPALKYSRLDARPGSVERFVRIGRRHFTGSELLIAVQVGLSLSLLLGAGLLAHSLLALEQQDVGFRRDNVLVVQMDAGLAGYQSSELFPLYRDIGDRLARIPGVVSASVARFTPESGNSSSGNFSIEGYSANAGTELDVYDVPVGPGFFETLGMRLLRGRTISSRDTPGSPAVAVVNETFVKRYLPNENPVGRRMILGSPFKAPGAEIVGVVADARFYDLRDKPKPMVFFSPWQRPVASFEAVVRTAGAAANVVAEVREGIKGVSSRLPVLDTLTLSGQIEKSLDQQRMITVLCSILGLLAVILAGVGIYGTLAHAVAGRTGEIGIRMAVGAQGRNVIWLIAGDSLVVIGIGILLGLPVALSGTRWLRSFLFGVQEMDPAAIGSAVLLVLASALMAGYFPARRAARIDPMRALRHD